MEFNSLNEIIMLVFLHSFSSPVLSLSFPVLGDLGDPSLQTAADGLPRQPPQWLISCVSLAGPGGAQTAGQALFWVCLPGCLEDEINI